MCEDIGFNSAAAWYILTFWVIGVLAIIAYAVKKGKKRG